jgi:hypothetical protein
MREEVLSKLDLIRMSTVYCQLHVKSCSKTKVENNSNNLEHQFNEHNDLVSSVSTDIQIILKGIIFLKKSNLAI